MKLGSELPFDKEAVCVTGQSPLDIYANVLPNTVYASKRR